MRELVGDEALVGLVDRGALVWSARSYSVVAPVFSMPPKMKSYTVDWAYLG